MGQAGVSGRLWVSGSWSRLFLSQVSCCVLLESRMARRRSLLPKQRTDFCFLAALTTVVIIPYILGTRVARLFWRSRVRFYKNYQHQ